MKMRTFSLLATACLLIAAAWLVHAPDEARADTVSEKYRETVKKGLDYLARQQCKDGHWEGDGGKHPVAMTGLAGIALLMEPKEGYRRLVGAPHAANVRKAADWLMEQSRAERDGLIFSGHPSEAPRYM